MTELLSMHSSRTRAGRQAQNAPAWLMQRHFPDILGTTSQCVWYSREKNFMYQEGPAEANFFGQAMVKI